MVTHAPLTGGEARRTRIAAFVTLTIGLLPFATLFSIGIFRSAGFGNFPAQFYSPDHPFWQTTSTLSLVGVGTLFLSFIATCAICLTADRLTLRHWLDFSMFVGIHVLLLWSTPLLLRILTNMAVLHD